MLAKCCVGKESADERRRDAGKVALVAVQLAWTAAWVIFAVIWIKRRNA